MTSTRLFFEGGEGQEKKITVKQNTKECLEHLTFKEETQSVSSPW